jgi:hypothetical protein
LLIKQVFSRSVAAIPKTDMLPVVGLPLDTPPVPDIHITYEKIRLITLCVQ